MDELTQVNAMKDSELADRIYVVDGRVRCL